jgi:hypothetical protein
MSRGSFLDSSGNAICGALTILFVILKVFHAINWSWWLVFAPLWVPTVAVFAIFVAFGAAVVITILAVGTFNFLKKVIRLR